MDYEIDFELYQIINIYAIIIGLAYGVVAQKTQFCFNGAIKDYVLSKSTRRAASIFAAMISAVLSSQILSYIFFIDFSSTIYLKSNINYLSIIFGGVLFGIGMMKADGCSSRQLIKFSQGDLHSLVTLMSISIFAYITSKGVLSYFSMKLNMNEYLLKLSSYIPNEAIPIYFIVIPLVIVLFLIVPKIKNLSSCIDGLLVGLLIGISWFVTGVLGFDEFEPVGLESLSFVYPSGKALEYIMFYSGSTLSFGVSIVFGVIIGGFAMSLFNKKYKFNCAAPQNSDKLKNSILGGSLMGIGGILSLGCTIGQGLSGLSTLAVSSLLAIISIGVSAYITALNMSKRDALPNCFSFDWKI